MVRKSKEKEKTGDGSGSDGSVAPFLKKCYEMVDDSETDSIISWCDTNDSFVIKDVTQFSLLMLPKYFKHSNFSSFMRQLNIYGFRKIDTDCYVFANEGFIRGQKHLMKNIFRRKYPHGTDQRKSLQQEENSEEHYEDIENNLWREVESLKIDKISLKQELVKLRQHQEMSENKLLLLRDRLHGMEKDQQQMLSFLVMAMQNPGFLVQLLQPKEKNWRLAEADNMLEEVDDDKAVADDGVIVRYQPPVDEALKPVLTPQSGSEKLPVSESFVNSDGVIVRYQPPMDEPLNNVLASNSVPEKQREFNSDPDGMEDSFMNPDGVIVKYQQSMDAVAKPVLAQNSGTGKQPEFNSSPDGTKDFFVNPEFLKMLMDDQLSPRANLAPFLLPDATDDDNTWEKLLLSSYLLENTQGTRRDGQEADDSRMEVESTAAELDETEDFDALIDQMNKSVYGSTLENSQNMEPITGQPGSTATDNPNKTQGTQSGK